ncbi:hypothetical protein Dimus_001395 [Dionaea muscipula]
MIVKLVPRFRELQNQLQDWTEWANQKVMQAARRLSKDKAELKTLRREKEEMEWLKKEKKTLEENTMKKLSEMENALSKASGQVERANDAVWRLEVENLALRQEMEAAKLRAAESAASCQEVSKREKKMLTKFRSWERQKILFLEELAVERRKLAQLQLELEQAQNVQLQSESCVAHLSALNHGESLMKLSHIQAVTRSNPTALLFSAEVSEELMHGNMLRLDGNKLRRQRTNCLRRPTQ